MIHKSILLLLICFTVLTGYSQTKTAVTSKQARIVDEINLSDSDIELFKEQTMGYPVIMGSNTEKTLAVELNGREKIVVHRNDKPQEILDGIKVSRCFIIGGGMTYTKFAPFLTHIYITPHPIVFGKGIKLFSDLKEELFLKFIQKNAVNKIEGIFQFQYEVIR